MLVLYVTSQIFIITKSFTTERARNVGEVLTKMRDAYTVTLQVQLDTTNNAFLSCRGFPELNQRLKCCNSW
jgi:hypothetical protein